MWFARFFGRHDDHSQDEQPTAAPSAQPATVDTVTARSLRPVGAGVAKAKPKGFDPYNSGEFKRRNAWERVGRR